MQHINFFNPFSWSGIQEMRDKIQEGIDAGIYDRLQGYATTGNPLSPDYTPEFYTQPENRENPEPEKPAAQSKTTTYLLIAGAMILAIVLVIKFVK